MVVLLILITIAQPRYIHLSELSIKWRVWMPLILAAVGQTFVILGGGIDLSIGSMIALVNVGTVQVMMQIESETGRLLAGLLVGLLIGLLAGFINGLCVSYLRLQPIITTFATGIVWHGGALWIMEESGGDVPFSLYDFYAGEFLRIPVSLWFLFVLGFLFFFIRKTSFYTHLKATGGNLSGAFETGLEVTRIRMLSYVICGGFTALAAFSILGETITGNPHAGAGYELEAISSVVIGGTSLAGGFGGPIGSIFGAMIMKLVNDFIFFFNIPVNFQKLMQGVIIVAALAFGGIFTRTARGRRR
jgi:ribose transport system permease protein